jgi:outer membrane immunogenic protein
MKKLVLALTALAAFTGSASAADMAARPMKAPPPLPAPVMSWTGCWISGGGGYQYDRINHEVLGGPLAELRTQNISSAADGWILTAGVGCDYQFSNRWVIGGFVDGTWSDNVRGDYGLKLTGVDDIGVGRIKNPWSWAVGGRVGYLVAPNVLSYVNAGFTQTHFDAVNIFDRFTNGGAFTGVQIAGRTLDGVFVGTGFEYSFDWLPGLFLKSEGRAAWFDRKNVSVACVTDVNVSVCPGNTGSIAHNIDRRETITYMAKTELVYRFNWGGAPIAARY